jgi:filamentous hemagglutinin
MRSEYDSVVEQSGIYAGKGGFDVTVGNHTQLDGAVIASTATEDKNRLDTGTLGWTDIHNAADYKASHTGISLSGASGMSAGQMAGANAMANAANAITGLSGSKGHAEGTTSSAVSGGSIIIRDKDKQQQDVAELSRDVENANGSIAPIFDKEKEQQRLKEAQVISQIAGQLSNIVTTLGETEAMKAARDKHGNLSDAALRNTQEYKDTVKGYGTGSTPQMVVQAITGVLGGLNADNFGQALAGGLSPVMAQAIKHATGDNQEANLMAHAVWGALAAQLSGNNAAAGAAGVFSGELAAQYITNNYYGGKTDNLSEQERQQISTLATIAAGIAGGLAGNSTEAAGTGAQAGKNAVENNLLGGTESGQEKFVREHGKNIASCGTDPGSASCQKGLAMNDALMVALPAGLGGGILAAATPEIAAAAQAAIQSCAGNVVLCLNSAGIQVSEAIVPGGVGAGGAVGIGKTAAEATAAKTANNAAHSAASGLNLNKSLANEAQLADLAKSGGSAMAGNGSDAALKDSARLVAEYGGQTSDWSKISSQNYKAADGTVFEIHAYRNAITGQLVEPKTIAIKK